MKEFNEKNNVEDITFDVNSNIDESNDNFQYNATVLFVFLQGMFGIHRLINGKMKSGTFMLITSSIIVPIFSILYIYGFFTENVALMLTGLIYIPFVFAVDIMALVDLVMVITGSFKDKNNVPIKSSGPFMKNWVHVFIISYFVYTMIISFVVGIGTAVFIGNNFEDYFDIEYEYTEQISYDNSETAIDAINSCLYEDELSDTEFESVDSFKESVSGYFNDKGYTVEDDKELPNSLIITKEAEDITYALTVTFESVNDKKKISFCGMFAVETIDDVEYTIDQTPNAFSESKGLEYFIMVLFEDRQTMVNGQYFYDEERYELSEILTGDYDVEKDEKDIVENLENLIDKLKEEGDFIFNK